MHRSKDRESSSSTSTQSRYLTYLHSPGKDTFVVNTAPVEDSYQLQPFGNNMAVDLHPPFPSHVRSDSRVTTRTDPGQLGNSRPGSQRSAKKNSIKRVNVQDILAMRRMEQGGPDPNRDYPGIQPMRLTASPTFDGQSGEAWSGHGCGRELDDGGTGV